MAAKDTISTGRPPLSPIRRVLARTQTNPRSLWRMRYVSVKTADTSAHCSTSASLSATRGLSDSRTMAAASRRVHSSYASGVMPDSAGRPGERSSVQSVPFSTR